MVAKALTITLYCPDICNALTISFADYISPPVTILQHFLPNCSS